MSASAFDSVVSEDIKQRPVVGGKYKVNEDFNKKDVAHSSDNTNKENQLNWIPTILRDEKWEQANMELHDGDDANNKLSQLDRQEEDPFQVNTIYQKVDLHAREEANFRKYDNGMKFKDKLLHNDNLKQMKFKGNETPIMDTFANKHKGIKYNSTMELINNKSDENIEKVFKESNDIMNKIKKDSLKSQSEVNSNANVNNNESSYSQYYTSDAEEFESIQSTTRKYALESNELFDNLRKGLNPVTRDYPTSKSDYTSVDEEEQDGEEEGKKSYGDSISIEEIENKDEEYEAENIELTKLLDIVRYDKDVDTGVNIDISDPKLIKSQNHENEKDSFKPFKVAPGILATPAPGHKGLKFIAGSEFKNKKWDILQSKFITVGEYEKLYGNNEKEKEQDNYDDSSSNNIQNKFGETNELTSNTIIKEPTNSNNNEISFSQTNENLVNLISNEYPDGNWELIEELIINNRRLDKLKNLRNYVPNIWILNASNNAIRQFDGIPSGLQVLLLNNNKFDINSIEFDKLNNLQILDLSFNKIINLRILKNLRNLTNLNLQNNKINTIDGLGEFHMLRYLNLSHNEIKGELNFNNFKLSYLEDLILDDNEITKIHNLVELKRLNYLSLKRNKIKVFSYADDINGIAIPRHEHLRKLNLNDNKLNRLIDFKWYPNLKDLRVDKNYGLRIKNLSKFIDRVSVKFNNEETVKDLITAIEFSKDLNIISIIGSEFPLFNKTIGLSVKQLDLSATNMTKLPINFSEQFPFLIDLNLNFNKLRSLNGISNLRNLKQLKLFSNEIENMEDIVKYTKQIRNQLRLIDLRLNPITKGYYPYVFYDNEESEEADAKENDEGTMIKELQEDEDIEAFTIEYTKLYQKDGLHKWENKNSIFNKNIKNDNLLRKTIYKGQLLLWFRHLKYIDGIFLTKKDIFSCVSEIKGMEC